MDISKLEEELANAKRHLAQTLEAGRAARKLLATLADFEAVVSTQRNLAAAKAEEYAVPLDIGFVPEAAVSEPVLLQTEDAVVLTFSAMRTSPDGKREDAGYGVVQFDLCTQTKFGYPNDE